MQHECLLIALEQDKWVNTLQGEYNSGRLVLHRQQRHASNAMEALQDPSLTHGRYDAALIYVDQDTISHWRTALSINKQNMPATIIYSANLKPQALRDFLYLGASDFIKPPFNVDELRTRLDSIKIRYDSAKVAENIPAYNIKTNKAMPTATKPAQAIEADMCDNILEHSGAELEAFAVALASQQATSKESFRSAKSKIIARFEMAYIQASLMRYSGNVTLAARMAQKHRRAFWALMKKHNISPNAYRNG